DGNLRVKIIHYAKDGGSWELQYHEQDSTMKSIEIVNDTAKDWLTTEIILTDALLNNDGEKGADLILQNKGTTNCRFHLIELTLPEPPAAVGGVSIKSNSRSYLVVASTRQLEAIISPGDAANQDVTWASLNPEIATVDSMGLVTAVAIGTATIEVTTIDGGFTETIDIEVISGDEDFVLIKSPATNDDFFFGQAVKVIADGYDSDGIERMRFRVDGGSYNNVTVPPYEYTFNNLSLGTHTFEVQMKDSILPVAGRILSAPVTIIVIPAPSSDATLSDLSVEGTTITDFAPNKEVYDVELPEGTTDVPLVTATATDENADVQVTDAESLPGTTSIVVTAEDSVTTKTYTINFTVADPDVSIYNLSVSDTEFAKVYPNPVKEFLNIKFATAGMRKINLFNNVGQRIYFVQTNTDNVVIDIRTLNIKGLVTLQIKTDNSVTNHKVIVKQQ
ncbi:MAG: Ig-like domain-containing protein, partial [Bacteroidales bacterium]|nr:Ig-like domain-containing protein [Bacteroidales bacterium]